MDAYIVNTHNVLVVKHAQGSLTHSLFVLPKHHIKAVVYLSKKIKSHTIYNYKFRDIQASNYSTCRDIACFAQQ